MSLDLVRAVSFESDASYIVDTISSAEAASMLDKNPQNLIDTSSIPANAGRIQVLLPYIPLDHPGKMQGNYNGTGFLAG